MSRNLYARIVVSQSLPLKISVVVLLRTDSNGWLSRIPDNL